MKTLMKKRSDSGEGDRPTMHPRSQPYRDLMSRIKQGGSCSEEANTLTSQDVSERPRSFVSGKRAAAADGAEDNNTVKGRRSGNNQSSSRYRCTHVAGVKEVVYTG